MVDMRVELAGLELTNPVLLASGILDSTPGILARMADAGAGALVTKSISLKPRPGYAGPTVAEVAPGTWINAMGLPNPGLAEFLDEFDLCGGKVPIIPNLVADTPAEFGELAAGVAGAGAKLADYAVQTGVDAVGVDETIDPHWAHGALPAGMPVQGNLDPLALIAGGRAVEEAVDAIRAAFAAGNNRASAAEMLGVSRQNLYDKLRRFGIDGGRDEEESVAGD